MAVDTDHQKLRSSLAVTAYDFDPGATTATDIGWVDMRDFDSILISFFRTVGTSAATLSVLGNPASDGSGTDVTIKTKVLTAAEPDAVGDYTFIEVSAEEIRDEAGAAAVRYVSASVSVATGTDEGVVTYIRRGKHQKLNLTADNIA